MMEAIAGREVLSSEAENRFVELFTDVFGLQNAGLLAMEFPVKDIYGATRFIDYAIRTPDECIAFEIDGLVWHVPDPQRIADYEGDLLRQNSLIHDGWRVFRWTDRQILSESDKVKQQLELFLERIPGLIDFDDFLPKQHGEILELRPHQEEALEALLRLRSEGNTIALVTHAQGAGKTVTAIFDARRLAKRTLFVAHTQPLVHQAHREFRKHWPDVETGLFLDERHEIGTFNVAGTVQSVARHLDRFDPNSFGYLIIDEAHHAEGETYKKLLRYFRPQFILGLTATPDRADGISALEVFQNTAHRLSLREAIEKGELVPIRCVRVRTNVDLSRVRFNQVQYNRRDIEEAVRVPSRDRLILETYQSHVPGRKAVVFCVNVRHAEDVAQLFLQAGITARSVSGRTPVQERKTCLEDFARGNVRVLCACDLLNEGWDCPDIEVLMMARPTLSRVIYLQQLGRGTRKAPGKDCLVVFDFVDNATQYNQSLSLHRVVGQGHYRAGSLVLASAGLMSQENEALARGDVPTPILPVELWTKELEVISVFNWQEETKGMISHFDLEDELAASEGRVRAAIDRGALTPDHSITLGERTYHYFLRERVEEIRLALGLPRVDDSTIRAIFLEFVQKMDMSSSYKPVMLLSMLKHVNERGGARIDGVVESFHQFYLDRLHCGLPVERQTNNMARAGDLSGDEVRALMLRMPFQKFEQKKFMSYDRNDVAYVRFSSALWRQLSDEDKRTLRNSCEAAIARYYERIEV
jgi:superfamily II DNA or RNA helicase